MGDRISISFKNENDESVVLFSHWGGMGFYKTAIKYLLGLKKALKKKKDKVYEPLDRMEPNTMMIDFIRHITKDMKRVESDLYLGATSNDGDNSDNGHFTIDVNEDWEAD